LDSVVQGLQPSSPVRSDLEVLTDAFGPLLFVHLRREDVVGQAVSWARAEQTGSWQQGDAVQAEPHFDIELIETLVRTVREHNAAWCAWFARHGVQPHGVTYEEMVGNPRRTVLSMLDRLAVEAPSAWRPQSPQVRQGDQVNRDWVRRYLRRPDELLGGTGPMTSRRDHGLVWHGRRDANKAR
jgi:trehalose 2-sulfotransferase